LSPHEAVAICGTLEAADFDLVRWATMQGLVAEFPEVRAEYDACMAAWPAIVTALGWDQYERLMEPWRALRRTAA
jgi:hypothetical protein